MDTEVPSADPFPYFLALRRREMWGRTSKEAIWGLSRKRPGWGQTPHPPASKMRGAVKKNETGSVSRPAQNSTLNGSRTSNIKPDNKKPCRKVENALRRTDRDRFSG